MTQTVTLGTSGLTQDEVVAVARHSAKVVISPAALEAMAKTRAHIERLAVSETPVYGLSTGFGALANRHIDIADRVQLQKSLIRSHAAGMGAIVETEVTRALMLLRLKTNVHGSHWCSTRACRNLRRNSERKHYANCSRVRLARMQR